MSAPGLSVGFLGLFTLRPSQRCNTSSDVLTVNCADRLFVVILIKVLAPNLGDDFPEILYKRLRAIRIHRPNHALRPTLPTDGQNRRHIAPDKENRLIALKVFLEVLRMTFIFILLLFPSYQDPNAQEMNYAVVVLGFVLVFCVVYYWFPKYGGRTFFKGPVRTIDEVLEENPDVSETVERQLKEEKASQAGTEGEKS